MLFSKIKKWLIGTGFEVGEKVLWEYNPEPSFDGDCVVVRKRNKKGHVLISNGNSKYKSVPWWCLRSLD